MQILLYFAGKARGCGHRQGENVTTGTEKKFKAGLT